MSTTTIRTEYGWAKRVIPARLRVHSAYDGDPAMDCHCKYRTRRGPQRVGRTYLPGHIREHWVGLTNFHKNATEHTYWFTTSKELP
jgi:hypothetical protein